MSEREKFEDWMNCNAGDGAITVKDVIEALKPMDVAEIAFNHGYRAALSYSCEMVKK